MEVGTGLQIGTYSTTTNVIQRVYVLSCKPNTTYTISKEIGKWIRAFTSEVYPAEGVECQTDAINDGSNTLTITSRENDKYLGIYLQSTSETTLNVEEILSKLMVVEGSETREYQPYMGGEDVYLISINLDNPLASSKNLFNKDDYDVVEKLGFNGSRNRSTDWILLVSNQFNCKSLCIKM